MKQQAKWLETDYPLTASSAPMVACGAARHWPERSTAASSGPGLAHWAVMLEPTSESDPPDKLPLDKLPLPHPATSANTIAASRSRSRECLVINVRMLNFQYPWYSASSVMSLWSTGVGCTVSTGSAEAAARWPKVPSRHTPGYKRLSGGN